MNSMKRQKDKTLEDEPLRFEGVRYTTGEEKRAITNSFRKNEAAGLWETANWARWHVQAPSLHVL